MKMVLRRAIIVSVVCDACAATNGGQVAGDDTAETWERACASALVAGFSLVGDRWLCEGCTEEVNS